VSGREAGHQPAANPDALEVAPGKLRENLQGWVPELASAEELRTALEEAFDYRGDVLITRKDRTQVEGYVFDRRTGRTLNDSFVRILPQTGGGTISVSYADIAALAFTGRDMAAGKSWENWVRQYWEKRMAGEHISLHPEELE
jgi:hypothetical protein